MKKVWINFYQLAEKTHIFLNRSVWHTLLGHMLLVLTVSFLAMAFFFFIYLPVATYPHEYTSTPNLVGQHIDSIDKTMDDRELLYEVSDSSYDRKLAAGTILKQIPRAGKEVKQNRVVYLITNRQNAKSIFLPNIIGSSIKNTRIVLKNYNLKIGNVVYVPDIAANAILALMYRGDTIQTDTITTYSIVQNSTVDLLVGNGMGEPKVSVPNLIGKDLREISNILLDHGFSLGRVSAERETRYQSNTIIEQSPAPLTKGRVMDSINVVIAL